MRLADIFYSLKLESYNKAISLLTMNEEIKNYLKVGDNNIIPVVEISKITDFNNSIILIDNIKDVKVDIANFSDSSVLIFIKKIDDIVAHGILRFCFEKKLLIVSIQETDYTKRPLTIICRNYSQDNLDLLITNNELHYTNYKNYFLDSELEDYKGARLKYKRMYEEKSQELETRDCEAVEYKRMYEEKSQELETRDCEAVEYKRMYEEKSQELEDYKGSRLKYKRMYEEKSQELEDYKGSRLKYKRLYTDMKSKYVDTKKTVAYQLGLVIVRAYTKPGKNTILMPFYAVKTIYQGIKNKKSIKVSSNTSNQLIELTQEKERNLSREDVRKLAKIQNFIKDTKNQPIILLYGEISLNVVDGSSIWLSSMYNTCISSANVILLAKQNIKKDLITSNFIQTKNKSIIIEPFDLDIEDDLSAKKASEILHYIDEAVPNIQILVTRGIGVTKEIVQTNCFKYRLMPYLTNFYTPTENGPQFVEESKKDLQLISHSVKTWLWQTKEMKEWAEKETELDFSNSKFFPPMIDNLPQIDTTQINKEHITIGYAGKIQPDWGVLELLEETSKLATKGMKIKLLIISSKISWRSNFVSGEGFVEKVKRLLEANHITYIQNLNRKETLEKLSKVDFIWCYRPAYFEENTLELSTKLLEAIALKKPTICYPNSINKTLFGKDFPYYLKDVKNLENILTQSKQVDMTELSKNVISEYSFESRKDFYNEFLAIPLEKTLTFAGHDYKFVDHFYSYLKSNGYQVYKDTWEWGEAQSFERSEYCYNNSDILFCEWGLANAVWYSRRNKNMQKPLFIRIHAQEIRQKAMKFSRELNVNNVSKFIFVSERIKQKAQELYDWSIDKCDLVPNYVLTDDFKPFEINKEVGLNFGMVGITPQSKRLDRAISLMELIIEKYPNAKLYIKGERPENYSWMHAPGRVEELDYYYKQYDRIQKNPKLQDAIIFDGFGNDMAEWYQKIDFILSPSDFESFHYALADGVASGCIPIVWNWEEASTIYTIDWVVGSEVEAMEKVEKYFLLTKSELVEERENNRDLIIDRYGYKSIFKELTLKVFDE